MPIVRIDNKGEVISDEVQKYVQDKLDKLSSDLEARQTLRRRNAKIAGSCVLVGMTAAAYVFLNHDPLTGIFCGLVPICVAGVLNLLD